MGQVKPKFKLHAKKLINGLAFLADDQIIQKTTTNLENRESLKGAFVISDIGMQGL